MSAAANVFDFNTAALPASLPTPQDQDRRLEDLRSALRSRAKDVVRDVFPHARVIGHTARIGDLGGAPGESLAIEISGDKAGLWMDHATAESGDLIALWTATQGYKGEGGFWQAVEDLELHLGLASGVAWAGPVARVAEARKRQPTPPPVSKVLENTHVYTDASGHVLGKVFRYRLSNGKKTFMQQNAAGEWKAPAEPRPLYNLPAITPANTVVLVEGEKCVDRLSALGVEATTVMGGSNVELHRTDWSPIAGKRVILWADNDGEGKTEATSYVGQRYMDRLEPHLRALGCQVVRAVIPAGVPLKWDAADATDDEALAILRAALARFVDAPATSLPGRPDMALLARPFTYRDPALIPPRRWLYKPHLIRGFVSLTVSPGGVGKSALTLCEAMAIASGRPLMGVAPTERARVWVWNGEDPADENERRVHAIMAHHRLAPRDVEGWLFTGSGRDADLVVAMQDREGVRVAVPVVETLIAFLRENDISAVVIDPFVSSHQVMENDNGAIDRVVKTWGRIAQATGCAIDLVHHTRKTNGAEVSVEDGRGASALLAGSRHARTLARMTDQEADGLGVERSERRSYVHVVSGKANLSPAMGDSFWFRLASVHLPNGDQVQAATPWTPPDALGGLKQGDLLRVQHLVDQGRGEAGGWRENIQAGEAWVGHAVASVLQLDLNRIGDMAKVKALLRCWMGEGLLTKEARPTGSKGKPVPFVVVGRWAEG